ncbi:carboxymuconolactone decarboxylase family protein [Fodinicola acaciae]|uniref:carboxymuconolactone decarboxylase family protein n=1 Tax=Fodinicola acaciae TaxID=2681555 RepID=UPI001C9E5404|nr:carboxymuconolactone decarboxylase family protein [Fodinicola acaciae]
MSDYVVPTTRLNAKKEAPEAYLAMLGFAREANDGVEPKIAELVKIRASQINGCAFCVDSTRGMRRRSTTPDGST